VGSTNQIVEFGQSETVAGLAHGVSRRVSMSEYASYRIDGGLDDASRAAYPRQRGGGVRVSLDYALSAQSLLSTGANASHTLTDPNIQTTIVGVEERWRHVFRSRLELTLALGAAYSRSEAPELPDDTAPESVSPTGSVRVGYGWFSSGAAYQLDLESGVAPRVDRFSGVADERVSWTAVFSRSREPLTLVASTSGTQSLQTDDVGALSSFSGSLGAILQLHRELSLNATVSASDQDPFGESETPTLWSGVVGFTYQPDPFRL
jgi:hypothetical protein